ncbi:MAG: PAS domain S-box protein [Gemmatimonadota bacterium]|nr:MAG: PAS domain S-box protein [Gemmatimonadota bacterium]
MSPSGTEPARNSRALPAVLRRRRLVWKVNGVFLVILVCVLGISSYVTNLDYERAELESARDISRVTSERIHQRIKDLMLRGEPRTLGIVVNRMASENPAYRDIRLIAHGGRVVASQLGETATTVQPESWPCNVCHGAADSTPSSVVGSFDEVLELEDGERAVSVATPVVSEAGCSTGECHAGATEGQLLGVIQADFSLARVDALVSRRNLHAVVVIVIALLFGTAVTWWMTDRLVGSRIRALREGAQRLADHDYSFRFSDPKRDGLAQVEEVFDSITSEISTAYSELLNTQEYLQGIVENSPDIIITVDPTGIIDSFNRGAEQILGYSQDEVVGRRIEMLFADPRERDVAIEQLSDTDHVVNYLTHFRTKDGDIRNVLLTLSRLRAPDGAPIGTIGISKDVTREMRLQRKLVQSERMAALGQALTGIQHSIKNLLNVLKGGSYMVKLGLTKDNKSMLSEGWQMVEEGITHMTEMSKSMLDFARERDLDLTPTSLAELMAKVRSLSAAKFEESGVQLSVETTDGLPTVQCDPELIRSVVMDLLSNALDACSWKDYDPGETPWVKLWVGRGAVDGYAQIEVSDNGPGMEEEVKAKIFTPFFSTKKQKGTGMGLAVVSRIVSSHGGTTTVESELGKGATFRVMLPVEGPSLREEEADVETGVGSR